MRYNVNAAQEQDVLQSGKGSLVMKARRHMLPDAGNFDTLASLYFTLKLKGTAITEHVAQLHVRRVWLGEALCVRA